MNWNRLRSDDPALETGRTVPYPWFLKPERVLVVTDSTDELAAALFGLEVMGNFMGRYYRSGEDALLEIARFEPDIVLFDASISGLNRPSGLRFLEKRRHELQSAPVIFLVDNDTSWLQEAGIRRFGTLGVLRKPLDPEMLAGQILRLWEDQVTFMLEN